MAISVIYGAIVAVLTWNSYPSDKGISYETRHLELLSQRTRLILEGRVQPPVPADAPAWVRDPIILEMPNGHRFEVVGTTTMEQSKAVATNYIRVLNAIASERRKAALRDALLAWAAPSLLLFALGWAVSGIYRGFGRGGT
jgi:hypothetical protein